MLDIFNHLAVFAALALANTIVGLSFIKSISIRIYLVTWVKVMATFFITGEIIAWSIYYLSGAGV